MPEYQTEKETETNTNVFMTVHCNYKTDTGLRESFPKLKSKKVYNCPQNQKSQELLSLHSFHFLSLCPYLSLFIDKEILTRLRHIFLKSYDILLNRTIFYVLFTKAFFNLIAEYYYIFDEEQEVKSEKQYSLYEISWAS